MNQRNPQNGYFPGVSTSSPLAGSSEPWTQTIADKSWSSCCCCLTFLMVQAWKEAAPELSWGGTARWVLPAATCSNTQGLLPGGKDGFHWVFTVPAGYLHATPPELWKWVLIVLNTFLPIPRNSRFPHKGTLTTGSSPDQTPSWLPTNCQKSLKHPRMVPRAGR